MEKFKLWVKKAGFTSGVYFILFLVTLLFGNKILSLVGLAFLKEMLLGAFLGIFVYINWNVIKKIWNEELKPELDELADKVGDKIRKKK